MHTQHNITPTLFGLQTHLTLKMTLSEVVRVNVVLLWRHSGERTLEARINVGSTDRSDSASKCQLLLSLLIPFSCIEARRHRVWSRAFIHEGFSFSTTKNILTKNVPLISTL